MAFLKNFLFGKPGKFEQRSTLAPQQQQLFGQLTGALQGQKTGGAFGNLADYYQGLLSGTGPDFEAFAAPEQRQFREQTIPGLSEQFAGMGSGALSSSGFRNAAVGAGADLGERLGALRAQLRQQGAAGLQQMGQFGLSPQFQENLYRQGQPGLADYVGQGIGTGLGAFGGGGYGMAGNWLNNRFGRNRNQDPSMLYKSIDPRDVPTRSY